MSCLIRICLHFSFNLAVLRPLLLSLIFPPISSKLNLAYPARQCLTLQPFLPKLMRRLFTTQGPYGISSQALLPLWHPQERLPHSYFFHHNSFLKPRLLSNSPPRPARRTQPLPFVYLAPPQWYLTRRMTTCWVSRTSRGPLPSNVPCHQVCAVYYHVWYTNTFFIWYLSYCYILFLYDIRVYITI